MPISSSVLLLQGMQRQPSTQNILHYSNLQHNSLLYGTLCVLNQQLHLKKLNQNVSPDRQDTSMPLAQCVTQLVREQANATVFEHLIP